MILTSVLFQVRLGGDYNCPRNSISAGNSPNARQGITHKVFGQGNRHYQSSDSGVVDEIVNAVTELARQRTGALLVFQRFDGLDHLIVKGKELDSSLSTELLQAIFQKNSPLHDGRFAEQWIEKRARILLYD